MRFGVLKMKVVRALLRLAWLLPLSEKRIFFSAYEGSQFACSPKAIYRAMLDSPSFSDYRFVWEINDKDLRLLFEDARTIFVSHNSPRYFLEVMTSKVIITNVGITSMIPIRKNQINLNTWHGGGAFKRVGSALHGSGSEEAASLYVASHQTTFFLTSSRVFTEVMHDSAGISLERFAPTGLPRNDDLFDPERLADLRALVASKLKRSRDDVFVLYAPTYRGEVGEDRTDRLELDFDLLGEAVERRYGRSASLMVRMHYFNRTKIESAGIVDVSNYPDMQELLASADILITDYSSCVWDYALTGRPCFIFAYDIDDYDAKRGFYTPPDSWPGVVCRTNRELADAILSFDAVGYEKKVQRYLELSGSYETGCATALVLGLIEREMGSDE